MLIIFIILHHAHHAHHPSSTITSALSHILPKILTIFSNTASCNPRYCHSTNHNAARFADFALLLQYTTFPFFAASLFIDFVPFVSSVQFVQFVPPVQLVVVVLSPIHDNDTPPQLRHPPPLPHAPPSLLPAPQAETHT